MTQDFHKHIDKAVFEYGRAQEVKLALRNANRELVAEVEELKRELRTVRANSCVEALYEQKAEAAWMRKDLEAARDRYRSAFIAMAGEGKAAFGYPTVKQILESVFDVWVDSLSIDNDACFSISGEVKKG